MMKPSQRKITPFLVKFFTSNCHILTLTKQSEVKYMTEFIKNQQSNVTKQIDFEATGKNIKKLRENAGLSVKKLADIFEFETAQVIYQWQKGKHLPSLENLFLLSSLFNKDINDIVLLKNKQQV